ncbi:MAG TPA: 16S rRNA (guanine(527)-N(7))-methyltransferase RsmG [Allosphingosinicella sp.]|nr:16S rRNA (guanine(527)-N(7))-methyltransferase RsmG [Allosphingosinicella sp.]
MNEEEAKEYLDVPRETLERLDAFVALLRSDSERQNLVSKASLEEVWTRHIADSAQLVQLAPEGARTWLDLGTGAGFPGLIVALLTSGKTTLVESRKLRVNFLQRAAELLGIADRTNILCSRVENVAPAHFDVISARAFAPLDRLLTLGQRFAAPETRWVLPKGRNAKTELEAAESLWQGKFRLEPSLTDAEAQIIVAEQVRRKPGGKGRR